jgi:hypothetical protein
MTADLQTILERATAGRSLDKSRMFGPSWFYSMIKDPFWVWCEYHAPWQDRVDETTLFDRHRMQMGNEWEDRYVANNFPNAVPTCGLDAGRCKQDCLRVAAPPGSACKQG